MKTSARLPWLATLGMLLSRGVYIGGEGTARAGARWCTLEGAWINTTRGTTNAFTLEGFLIRTASDADALEGTYKDGGYAASVSGSGSSGSWLLSFVYTDSSGSAETSMVKKVTGTEEATDAKNQFSFKGTYTTWINGVQDDRTGDVTLSGICKKT